MLIRTRVIWSLRAHMACKCLPHIRVANPWIVQRFDPLAPDQTITTKYVSQLFKCYGNTAKGGWRNNRMYLPLLVHIASRSPSLEHYVNRLFKLYGQDINRKCI